VRKLDVTILMQFIKNLVTFSYIKHIFNIILPIFMNRLERITCQGFSLGWSNELSG
jgi:hypothetical protein